MKERTERERDAEELSCVYIDFIRILVMWTYNGALICRFVVAIAIEDFSMAKIWIYFVRLVFVEILVGYWTNKAEFDVINFRF